MLSIVMIIDLDNDILLISLLCEFEFEIGKFVSLDMIMRFLELVKYYSVLNSLYFPISSCNNLKISVMQELPPMVEATRLFVKKDKWV